MISHHEYVDSAIGVLNEYAGDHNELEPSRRVELLHHLLTLKHARVDEEMFERVQVRERSIESPAPDFFPCDFLLPRPFFGNASNEGAALDELHLSQNGELVASTRERTLGTLGHVFVGKGKLRIKQKQSHNFNLAFRTE